MDRNYSLLMAVTGPNEIGTINPLKIIWYKPNLDETSENKGYVGITPNSIKDLLNNNSWATAWFSPPINHGMITKSWTHYWLNGEYIKA